MTEHPDGYLYYSKDNYYDALRDLERKEQQLAQSYMGPNDDKMKQRMYGFASKHKIYEEVKKMLEEEREKELEKQAEALDALAKKLEVHDDDEFEIGGAL